MRYIKLFESYEDIEYLCSQYDIDNYTILPDMSINVINSVNLYDKNLKEIPINFNTVAGSFRCSHNKLTNLKKTPINIGGWFDCSVNYISNMKSNIKFVESYFCHNNNIKNLHFSDSIKLMSFDCSFNKLKSLNGAPNDIYEEYIFADNEVYEINRDISYNTREINYGNNPISELFNLFGDISVYIEYKKDYNFQKENIIYKARFTDALNELGIKSLPNLKSYIYV